MKEEIFGPIMPIFPYKNITEVVNAINLRPKPLAVYFYGKPSNRDGIELYNHTSSGAFMTNDCLMQCISHYQGFGGVGESGCGRYGGYEGFKQFSNPKSVLLKGPAPAIVRANIMPPYDQAKLDMTFKFMLQACLYTQADALKFLGCVFGGFTTLVFLFYYYSYVVNP